MLPLTRFTDFIEQNELFGHDAKIIAAVSAGMDSVLMAHLLKSAGFNFCIAHCNFQLRGAESNNEQAFCRQLAYELGVPFYTIDFDTPAHVARQKISTQMAARQLRYQWFEQLRQQHQYTHVALAHHQNDAIETILLNLTRGTGIAGMHGILPKNGNLVRPMLFLNRDEVQDTVKAAGLQYMEDGSNASVKYARNKIRHQVIPKLKELNPGLEQTFENNLQRFRELEMLLNRRVAALKKELFVFYGDEIHIPLAAIKTLEPKRLLLFNLLQEYGFNETAVGDIISALGKHPGRKFESSAYELILDRENLILTRKNKDDLQQAVINANDHEVVYSGCKLTLLHDDSPLVIKGNPMAASVDAELLLFPLTLRAWQQGDHFYPLGMKGRKKVGDFFIAQKVPLHTKHQVPLLVNGNGDIIWIAGHRLDERYKVTENTKKVIIFELYKPG